MSGARHCHRSDHIEREIAAKLGGVRAERYPRSGASKRIVPPDEVERLSALSWNSAKRNHPELIVNLSKRVGMRVGHALRLANNKD